MRHTDIEEEIVERRVHQRKGEDETPVDEFARLKRPSIATGNGQDYQASHSKPNARKEHLTASHVGCNSKGAEANLDEWERPSPGYGGCQGKDDYPCRFLEYGYSRLFHLII